MSKKILALDPSSTAIGWAVLSCSGRLQKGGIIKPQRQDNSYERIMDMCSALNTLLDFIRPVVILVEWTMGKVGKHRHRGRGAGLGIYGAGLGAAAATCYWFVQSRLSNSLIQIEPICENTWTRQIPKKDRQIWIAQEYPQYKIEDDPGGDLADAIGLAAWWIKEQQVKNNRKE